MMIGDRQAARWNDARALAELALLGGVDAALLGVTLTRHLVASLAARSRSATALAKSRRTLTVERLMTRSPVTCRPDDPLTEAASMMWQNDCGCVPVVRNGEGRPCGMITDRDVCMAAYHQGRALAEIRVRDVMARNVRTCSPADSVDEVGAMMREARVRRIPVVDDAGTLVGIISLADIALEIEHRPGARRGLVREKDVSGMLASIVRPHSGRLRTD